jgi:predicted RNA-binding Zn-ribbon protein involved in translation (DUF1610 family)
MSQHATHEVCPRCGGPAIVSWLGIEAYGHSSPCRREAVTLDCPNHCDFTVEELAAYFGADQRPSPRLPSPRGAASGTGPGPVTRSRA